MDKKMPKKISLKDFGMEKIILIAIAGIVLLAANFSEWKNSSSKTSEKQESVLQSQHLRFGEYSAQYCADDTGKTRRNHRQQRLRGGFEFSGAALMDQLRRAIVIGDVAH